MLSIVAVVLAFLIGGCLGIYATALSMDNYLRKLEYGSELREKILNGDLNPRDEIAVHIDKLVEDAFDEGFDEGIKAIGRFAR